MAGFQMVAICLNVEHDRAKLLDSKSKYVQHQSESRSTLQRPLKIRKHTTTRPLLVCNGNSSTIQLQDNVSTILMAVARRPSTSEAVVLTKQDPTGLKEEDTDK